MQDSLLAITSWNVRGMGDPIKRTSVMSLLEEGMPGLLCLQETHLTKDTVPLLNSRKFQAQFHSVHSSYSRGVSILVGRGVTFSCTESQLDDQGRYIFLFCLIENSPYVLANMYIPPPFKLDALNKLLGPDSRSTCARATIVARRKCLLAPV